MLRNSGLLAVISGFSGAGKGTLMKALLAAHDNYRLSISATTRDPRPGEENGREYFFVTKEKFEQMIADHQLIEHACYVENYYGTPRAYVEEGLAKGLDVLLEIEIQGALKIREQYPDALLIFITPPDAETLRKRLEGRGTETPEKVRARLRRAAEEADTMTAYDYIIVNDDLDTAARELHELIQSQHGRMSGNLAFAEKMNKDLKEHFLKEEL